MRSELQTHLRSTCPGYFMHIYILLAFLLPVVNYSYGQEFNPKQLHGQERQVEQFMQIRYARLDSLNNLMKIAVDSIKVDCLNDLSRSTLIINTKQSYDYLQEAMKLATQIGYKKGLAETYESMGSYYMEVKQHADAKNYFKLAADAYRQNGNEELYYGALLSFGYAKFLLLEYEKAIDIFNEVLTYRLRFPPNRELAFIYRQFGIVYNAQGKYEAAFQYFKKDMDISRYVTDSRGVRKSFYITSYFLMGTLFLEAGDHKAAIGYLKASAERAMTNLMPDVYDRRMAEIHFMQHNYDSALYYSRLAIYCTKKLITDTLFAEIICADENMKIAEVKIALNNFLPALDVLTTLTPYIKESKYLLPALYLNLAKAYEGTANYEKSLLYSFKLLKLANDIHARQFLRDAAAIRAKAFEDLSRKDSALFYYKLFNEMKDSISTDKQLRLIAMQQMKTEDEIKAGNIQLLQTQKAMADKQNGLLIILLISLVTCGCIVWRLSSLKRRNQEMKHRQLEDSLKVKMLETEKTKAVLQGRAKELEMQALRSQMNPHFIFNSLNSINYFILKNNKAEASEYLTKFSRLIRMILQNSQSSLISLSDELEALKLYIQLESLRFNYHFEYKITVSDEIDLLECKVPPLIIQPYVENAIWHGLMHKEEAGHLEVELSIKDDELLCRVTDDGVGRITTAEQKKNVVSTYRSAGMRITADRISILDDKHARKLPVTVIDHVLPDNTPAGTTVLIKISVNND